MAENDSLNDLIAFKAMVVDDEPLPRAHLTHLLKEAGLSNVLTASTGTDCLERLEQSDVAVDWVFLDVQMPGMNGIAVADALGAGQISSWSRSKSPLIVFVTGFEDYAIQAFDRAAVDYLLKPVDRERLSLTLARLRARSFDAPLRPHTVPVPTLQKLPIRLDYSVRLVDVTDIIAATTHDKRVDVITLETTYTTYYTLNQLERRLPDELFVRVHDSWIVRLSEIVEIHNLGSQSYQARLRYDGRLIPVSRRRMPLLQKRLAL